MNTSEIVVGGSQLQPLISDEALLWLRMILMGVVCQCMALLGVVTNVINIVVFIRMGVRDPMNISLLGLSISDFIGCFSVMWPNLCLFPPFVELDLPFDQNGAHFLYGSVPHVCFVKITTLITAFITVERCLCVTYPLKVKEIITAKRVTMVVVFFYLLSVALISPLFYVNYYDWVWNEERNRSLYALVFRENRDKVEPTLYLFMGVLIPCMALVSTIVATAILVYKLKKNVRWRQQVTGATTTKTPDSSSKDASRSQQVSSRDRKASKMVVMISALYLISFCPVMISTVTVILIPDIKVGGAFSNLLEYIFSFNFLLETTNGALNFFIYYYMSSNYKSMFRKMLGMGEKDKKIRRFS